MWIIITIIVILIVIAVVRWLLSSEQSNNYSNDNRRYTTQTMNRIRTIDDCISTDDIQYQLSMDEQKIVVSMQRSKNEIQRALSLANSVVSTAWLNSYEKVITISSNLDSNLNYHASRNLEISKFQYYTSLHFRSMIAADIVHNEFSEIDASFKELNQLIVRLKNSPRGNTGISKSAIYDSKDSVKALHQVFLSRVQEMNRNTAMLRDKIGNECGERGRAWRAERMRNR